MTNTPYTCPICGKVLKAGHKGAIGLHERSQMHKDAVNKAQDTKQIEVNPVIKTEPKPVINNDVRTTVKENINVKTKTNNAGRSPGPNKAERSPEPNGPNEWDGYLC